MTRLALGNPYAVIVGAIAIVLLGVVVALRLPVDLLPTFKTPAVQVLTLYPGMPATVVAADITSRIERWTGQSNGIARQESRSLTGVSVVRDYFRDDIDANTALSQVSSLAASDLYYLPPGTAAPMVMPFDPTAPVPLALLSVSSDSKAEKELYDVAYFQLRNLLQGIPGVIAPAVYGGKLRRVLVYVDPDKLQARGLAPTDISRALRAQNSFVPVGTAKIGHLEYQLDSNAIPDTVDALNDFPVKMGENGAPVLVRDIGHAEDAAQIQSNIVRIDGRRQVYIPIYRQPGANTIGVVDGVRHALASLSHTIGEAIKLDVIADQTVFVRNAISALAREGLLGAGLAALMIFLFLRSVRSSAVILLTIPLSVLTALIGLSFAHQSINAMTLGGLALVIGRLVDDAIVVLENTARHIAEGVPPERAALDAAREVQAPVLIATVATCLVFLPVLFLRGMASFLFVPLAIAVTMAMLASYVVAMTVIPTYAVRFLGKHREKSEARWLRALGRGYERVLAAAFRRGAVVVLVAVVAIGGAVALVTRLGSELFPRADAGHLTILARAPVGTRVETTESTIARAEQLVRNVIAPGDLQMLISNIGVLYDWPAAYTPNAGPGDAFFEVQLQPKHHDSSEQYAMRLRRAFREQLPELDVAFDSGGLLSAALNGGQPSPIHAQIVGAKANEGPAIAARVRELLARVRGAADVRVAETSDYPGLELDVDRIAAARLGLSADDVVKNVASALVSSVGFDPAFWLDPKNGNHYFLGVQFRENLVDDIDHLGDIPISPRNGGAPVPLKNVARVKRKVVPTEVAHANIRTVYDVYANAVGRDVGSVARDAERAVASLALPKGVAVELSGEVKEMRSSFAQLSWGLLLAAMLIYLLLVAQFRSFRDPVTILLAVPLGGIGAIGLLYLTGSTLNVQSLIGLLFMVGIAVSNSVLLVDFAARLRAAGRSATDAAREAAAIRLRPILMTSLAATLSLLPMALGLGHGDEANVPLARAVVGGLSASTALTLFVVPVVDAWLHRNDRPSPEASHA